MRRTKRMSAGLLVAAVAASGLLTACDEREQTRAAAVVDGTTILESDVQQAAHEFNTGSSRATQPMTPGQVVQALTYGHYVLPAMQQAGQGVSADMAKQILDKVDDPSPATVDFVRSALALGNMTPEVEAKVAQQLRTADITVNPRYGTYDAKGLAIKPEARNWMAMDADPAAPR